jgi:formylglycine-generating enzyme required for sulfatase activity
MISGRVLFIALCGWAMGCGSDEPTQKGKGKGKNKGAKSEDDVVVDEVVEVFDPGEVFSNHDGEMIRIEAGSFEMGSPKGEVGRHDDEMLHTVTLSWDYEVSKTEVTQGLWEAVMPKRPWAEKARRTDPTEVDKVGICDSVGNQAYGSKQPVYCITWAEAIKFCNELSKKEGLEPVYLNRGGRDVDWNKEANGYRLLTEAEWEYAARASEAGLYSGSDAGDMGDFAWHGGNANERSHPVGTKKPNAWGLYDMTGNVAEWTWDWYEPYTADAVTDPQGPSTGNGRVIRTSSFRYLDRRVDYPQESDRIASRSNMRPDWAGDWLGFRIARTVIDQ